MRSPAITAIAVAALVVGDALAQEAPSAPVATPPSDARAWDAEIAASRARHDDWLACVRAKRFKCEDDSKPDPMAALLNDDTLVNGDVVETPQGPKVFRGQPQTPHRREDFQ
jgi:hypothetical protein